MMIDEQGNGNTSIIETFKDKSKCITTILTAATAYLIKFQWYPISKLETVNTMINCEISLVY